MPSRPTPSAVVFVADVERVARFYRELADMQVQHADASHVVLVIEGLELVIHTMPNAPPVRERDVVLRKETHVKLCFPVTSIAEARERAWRLGGGLRDAAAEWEWRGFRACDGHDPEGNVIQVRESAE
jgi:predicted enzyme related to lactoylglutathione lyase